MPKRRKMKVKEITGGEPIDWFFSFYSTRKNIKTAKCNNPRCCRGFFCDFAILLLWRRIEALCSFSTILSHLTFHFYFQSSPLLYKKLLIGALLKLCPMFLPSPLFIGHSFKRIDRVMKDG